ncbi:MAG TPA: cytochrome P450 [Pseudonocardiaceae bacterium]|jgi:hypothetical protein
MNQVRSTAIWGIRYGLPGLVLRGAARRGDLIARLAIDPGIREEPFAAYDQLRARGPLVDNRVVSATATHRVANAVLRDERFVASPSAGPTATLDRLLNAILDPAALGPVDPPSLLTIHPPQHTRIRRLVSRAFTARAIAALGTRVREIAEELLDRIAEGPAAFDLIDAYAAPLPVIVIAEILGVPADMREQFLKWGNDAALTLDPGLRWRDYRRAERSLRELHRWLDGHLARLRREPGSDLLSQLVRLVDDGDRLSDLELRATALLILGAGFETTVNLIGNAVPLLLAHPDQLATLRTEPGGWGNAVDEVLRYDSPVQVTVRQARADADIAGLTVPNGRAVVIMLGGVNHDPEVFADPHRFAVTRANAAEHLAFSAGIHFCLGAQLAKLEASIALEALFDRFPDLATNGTPVRRGNRVLRGFEHLPVRTAPGREASRPGAEQAAQEAQ